MAGREKEIEPYIVRRLIFIRPAAEADLMAAKRWYEERRAGLGAQLLEVVDRALKDLEERAEKYPLYYREFRSVLLRRFPYKVFYRVENERVVVFRILHAKRDHPRHLGG